jgi:Kef-type K+ transport system membrane component KefB
LHFEPAALRGRGRGFAIIAIGSIAIPTLAGFIGGLWLAAELPADVGHGVHPVGFATAIGICIGVTALPVLGAILGEMDLLGRRIGDLALGVAAVNDAALWLVLGGLMTVLSGNAGGGPGLVVSLCGTPMYLAVMIFVLRPVLARLGPRLVRQGRISERGLAAVCAMALGSAMISEALGLHYIFGAFVAGTLMPRELRKLILDRLQVFTTGILMPFFFMITGLRTSIDLGSFSFFAIALTATGLAVVGKVGGTAAAARLTGESWANAFSLGALLQTKGLMELVVLTILLDNDVISANAFSGLTLMTVVSTLLAMPLARLGLSLGDRGIGAATVASSSGLGDD